MNRELDRQTAAAGFAGRLLRNRVTRRDTVWLFAASVGAASLQGCARSPVTGERILVGMSEADERRIDANHSPHQFSQDLGTIQNKPVNDYVAEVGAKVQGGVQRKNMPYSYRVLNANYVKAYTFPAGAMGVTRGILVNLRDEAELAALLGHELGHVNARHAAQQEGIAMVVGLAATGLAVANRDSEWAPLIGLGTQIGASALLASYSRDDERQADALGQQYLVQAGYPASGMVGLHQLLVSEERRDPRLLETLFSSHPMSRERLETAQQAAQTTYLASAGASPQRERFMDRTASLRSIKPTIEACQRGESSLSKKALGDAERHFGDALNRTPNDYAALLRMSQTLQARGRLADARTYVERARVAYPQEAQAVKLGASLKLGLRDPGGALADLDTYDRLLPGDSGVGFLKGVAYEGLGRRAEAARHFNQVMLQSRDSPAGQYASTRLRAWGYVR